MGVPRCPFRTLSPEPPSPAGPSRRNGFPPFSCHHRPLDRALDLREAVGPVLGAMARHMGMVRGTIALLNRETRQITIEAAYGLSASQQERGRYRLGEGGPGRVARPEALGLTRAKKLSQNCGTPALGRA